MLFFLVLRNCGTIYQWNAEIRQLSIQSVFKNFKRKLNCNLKTVSKYYNIGRANPARYHCRLRNECSNLNQHLCQNHIALNPLCPCDQAAETVEHYLFSCSKFNTQRLVLSNELAMLNIEFVVGNINIFIYGHDTFDYELNKKIFN